LGGAGSLRKLKEGSEIDYDYKKVKIYVVGAGFMISLFDMYHLAFDQSRHLQHVANPDWHFFWLKLRCMHAFCIIFYIHACIDTCIAKKS